MLANNHLYLDAFAMLSSDFMRVEANDNLPRRHRSRNRPGPEGGAGAVCGDRRGPGRSRMSATSTC
jgi:hypothetical protein